MHEHQGIMGNETVMSETKAVFLNHVIISYSVSSSVCVVIKVQMHFIKMDMLHIALVNVECKTLKREIYFYYCT